MAENNRLLGPNPNNKDFERSLEKRFDTEVDVRDVGGDIDLFIEDRKLAEVVSDDEKKLSEFDKNLQPLEEGAASASGFRAEIDLAEAEKIAENELNKAKLDRRQQKEQRERRIERKKEERQEEAKKASFTPSILDPETGKSVKITDPAVQTQQSFSDDPVDTEELTDGRVEEVDSEDKFQTGGPSIRRKDRISKRPAESEQDDLASLSESEARKKLFRREKEDTIENQKLLFGLKTPDVEQDFGTIDDQEFFREQKLENAADLKPGEEDILGTAAQQTAITENARQGGRQLTGTDLGGSIAVGGLSTGTDSFFLADQVTSLGKGLAESEKARAKAGERTIKGSGKVADEIVENPIEEAAPEILGAAFGVGSTVTLEPSTSTSTSFVDESSTVVGETSQSFDPRVTPEDIPSTERVPDLGEKSSGRDIQNSIDEPQNQILGQNTEEQVVVQGEPGRESGVPEQVEGLKQEEVEVLQDKRGRKEGVEKVDFEVEEFGNVEDGRTRATAEEVRFDIESSENDLTLSETFEDNSGEGSGLQGVLGGTRKGQTQGIPGISSDTTTEQVVEPDVGFDQTNTGRIETDTDTSIDIIEDRSLGRRQSSKPETGLDTGLDVGEGLVPFTSLGVSQDVRANQGLNTGLDEGLDEGIDEGLDDDLFREQENINDNITDNNNIFVDNKLINETESVSNSFDNTNNIGNAFGSSIDVDFDDENDEDYNTEGLGFSENIFGDTEFATSLSGIVQDKERKKQGEDPLFTGFDIRGTE